MKQLKEITKGDYIYLFWNDKYRVWIEVVRSVRITDKLHIEIETTALFTYEIELISKDRGITELASVFSDYQLAIKTANEIAERKIEYLKNSIIYNNEKDYDWRGNQTTD